MAKKEGYEMDSELLRAKSGVPTMKEKARAFLKKSAATLDPKIAEILKEHVDPKPDETPRQGELDF